MKTLMLLRHAKSSWKEEGIADHDRPLNKRGKKTAPVMGHLILENQLVPDLILSSTAVRARTTAEAVAEACNYKNTIEHIAELYLASAGELLFQAQSCTHDADADADADNIDRMMLVAHNPGMEDLVSTLSGHPEPFPTAALAVFELGIDSWRALELGVETSLLHLWRPRELE